MLLPVRPKNQRRYFFLSALSLVLTSHAIILERFTDRFSNEDKALMYVINKEAFISRTLLCVRLSVRSLILSPQSTESTTLAMISLPNWSIRSEPL